MEHADRPQVFFTYEWALAVQRAYRATLLPLLFLAYDANESLRGVAALATDASGKRVSFLCATTGDYCDFLSLPDERSAFVGAVFAELRRLGIGEVALANLPSDSGMARAIQRAAREHDYHYFARTGYVCAQVSFDSLDRNSGQKPEIPRRKMIRRFLKAMAQEGPVRLDHVRSWSAIQPLLPQLMQAHIARFLFTGRISNMARAERRMFLEELAELLSESGWLTLSRLMSGDKSLAWNYGFQFHGTWFWYQPTFDSDLEKFSPGFCMLAQLIDEAASNAAINVVDLGLGAEAYKDRFANQTRETLYVTLRDSRVAHLGEMLRYRATRLIQASPRIETEVRAVVGRAQKVRRQFATQGLGSSVAWLRRRFGELFWSQMEVFFYEWDGSLVAELGEVRLQRLDLNCLADATSQYAGDEETLSYLLRSAKRLHGQDAEGYALVGAAGKYLHFAWTTAFDGFFLSELNAKVDAPSPGCVMLFDCWTPPPLRGRGYYGSAIGRIAANVDASGKRPWIFSAATNVSSVRGLEKTQFQRRYSLVRKTVLGWQRIKGGRPLRNEATAEPVSPHLT